MELYTQIAAILTTELAEVQTSNKWTLQQKH